MSVCRIVFGSKEESFEEAVKTAKELAVLINERLSSADHSKEDEKVRSFLNDAKIGLHEIKKICQKYPAISIGNLSKFEEKIADIESQNNFNEGPRSSLNPAADGIKHHESKVDFANKAMGILSLSLKEQCHLLGIDLITKEIERKEKVEIDAFEMFLQEGYVGSHSEFGGFRVCLQSLCLDTLTETSVFYADQPGYPGTASLRGAREDAILGLSNRFSMCDAFAMDRICDEITNVTKERYIAAYKECLSYPMLHQFVKGLNIEFAEALFDVMPKSDFVKIARWLSKDWDNIYGWPDLVLVKGDRLRFVEVKTTDKLHSTQINTIPSLVREIGANVSVLKLKKARPKTGIN